MSRAAAAVPGPSTHVAPPPSGGREFSSEDMARAGLKAFFLTTERWELSADEAMTLLGRPARSTFYRWKRGETFSITADLLERLSHIIGIVQALTTLFPDPARAAAWIRRPNDAPVFGGRPALERLLAGGVSDLFVVRQYLAAEAAGAVGW